jgi:cytochrome c-type biogenesis protein CcmH
MKRPIVTLALALTVFLNTAAFAVEPEEMLADRALEQRARTISQDLRCMVCQNQSIDDSNAPLAKDLRVIVRERLTSGDTDVEVIEYVVARYGNYVLLKPPFQSDTALLWLAPFMIIAIALGLSLIYLRRQRQRLRDEDLSQSDTSDTNTAKLSEVEF